MPTVSYGVKIDNLTKSLNPTIKIYRNAVKYLVNISFLYYDDIKELSPNDAMSFIEKLTHGTGKRRARYEAFDRQFYKMPSYLRRNAIVTANAKVTGYQKSIERWKSEGCNGRKPHFNSSQDVMPCFYHNNMFISSEGSFKIKVYRNNDWVWQDIKLDGSDLKYIDRHCCGLKSSAPVLQKVNHGYRLRFVYKTVKSDSSFVKDVKSDRVLGVDLGLNSDAVCSLLNKDGTVTGCRFINSQVEKDRMYHLLNKIRKCYSSGNYRPHRLWRYVNNYNTQLAVNTASAIVRYAVSNKVQVIVFENLSSLKGSAHGINRQRIAIWRKKDIQRRVESMAARYGIRTAYVCASNTSKLAYDGSGRVERGAKAGFNSNTMCRFSNGKIYNCDLSASRNIGARYFIRIIKKSMPETAWSSALAKVPELGARTKCVLATLIKLNAVCMAL